MGIIALVNIGMIVTGDIKQPLSKANTLVVQDGKIAKIEKPRYLVGALRWRKDD